MSKSKLKESNNVFFLPIEGFGTCPIYLCVLCVRYYVLVLLVKYNITI